MVSEWQIRQKPVSIEEGLQVRCSKCNSGIGYMCVYIAGQWASYPNRYRAGQLCTRIHNERRNATRALRVKKWRQENRQRLASEVRALTASPNSRAAWRAMLEWERTEHNRLRDWLAKFGHILTGE